MAAHHTIRNTEPILRVMFHDFTYQVIDNLSLDNYNKVRKYAFDIGAGAQRSVFDLHP